MEVILLHNTPLWVCAKAIRTCWNSHDKSDTRTKSDECEEYGHYCPYHEKIRVGEKDKELIDRVGNKFKHSSTLEHLSYNFYIKGISRACLQELARHRIASLSVKSTRYTLKELKGDDEIKLIPVKNRVEAHKLNKAGFFVFTYRDLNKSNTPYGAYNREVFEKYLVFTNQVFVDTQSVIALINLKEVLQQGISNDIAKYYLPESYKTELTWTINARSLQNFLNLRTDKSALWEIRDLANAIYSALPEEHKYLFKSCLKGGKNARE